MRGSRCNNGGCIRQMLPRVLKRVVAHHHGRGGDRVAAARRVGGGRGVDGSRLLLVQANGRALPLELGRGNLLERIVVGPVALFRGAVGRCKEAEGVPGRRAVVGHVAALALEKGRVARVCGAGEQCGERICGCCGS